MCRELGNEKDCSVSFPNRRNKLKSNKINQKIKKLTKNMAILRPETYEKNNQDIERNNTTLPLKIKSNEEEVMETHSEGNALRT